MKNNSKKMMNATDDYILWMALAHLPQWRPEHINQLIFDILDIRKISLAEFFECTPKDWRHEFGLNDKEIDALKTAKSELSKYVSLAEKLGTLGVELIPYISEQYSPTLKRNLHNQCFPLLLYAKGNLHLLHETAVAIVGSRKASERALEFTKNIAQHCAKNFEVVVSGFLKGVERTALDETLNANGQSIIMLSQGILSFSRGFKQYYEQIAAGDLLVCSASHPKSRHDVELKKGQSAHIYGLAEKIYVAESHSEGRTWSNVIDGLKRGQRIYVRKPEVDEKNANGLLIAQGVKPVDIHGNLVEETDIQSHPPKTNPKPIQYSLFDTEDLGSE
jgi:DNA processing protein